MAKTGSIMTPRGVGRSMAAPNLHRSRSVNTHEQYREKLQDI